MKEPTRAVLTLGGLILLGFLIFWLVPNRTTLDTAQQKINKTAEQVKLYVDKKTKDAVEVTKVNTKTLEERISFLEKQDLTKDVLELQEQVANLVAENGQLKIYIATLEDRASTGAQVDKAMLAGAETHYKEFNDYKMSMNIIFQTLGTALASVSTELTDLDTRLDKLETQERSVLTKQTIVKTFYLHRHRCCR